MDSQSVATSGMIVMAMDVVASDWNNRIRDTVKNIASIIPQVGKVVSIIIGFFWPTNKVNIFEALKADIINLTKKEILDYELNLHKSEIDALKVLLERYEAAMLNEKGYFLNNWIIEADRLSVIFRQSTNNIHLIPLTITLALLHLTGLRERLDFGKQIYQEDNTERWKEDLEDMYRIYIVDFFPSIFKKWKEWRAEQVEIKAWTQTYPTAIPPFFRIESHATVEDTITGESRHYSVDLTESTTIFAKICEDGKARMCNDAFTDMAGCISTTFEYLELLPDNRKNFPRYDNEVFGRMFKGPYSQDLLMKELRYGLGSSVPIFRTRPTNDDYKPNSGPITKVIIREWNSIDAMQFIYANRAGALAGNGNGGQQHEINTTGKPINGLRLGFSSGVLAYVQILYYDGTSSSKYGNRSNWQCWEASPKGPPAYRVSSWSYKIDYGPSNTYGPSVVQLEYAPQIE